MKKDITIKDVKNAEEQLLPCPFCGIKPQIVICDDEGNIQRDDDEEEYLEDPWSGLSFALIHPMDKEHFCPVSTEKDDDIVLANYLYDSLDELIEKWNKRFISAETKNLVQRYYYNGSAIFPNIHDAKSWFDDISKIYMRLDKKGTYMSMTYMIKNGRLSYLKNLNFEEAVTKLREEWKNEFGMRFVFKNGDIRDYEI